MTCPVPGVITMPLEHGKFIGYTPTVLGILATRLAAATPPVVVVSLTLPVVVPAVVTDTLKIVPGCALMTVAAVMLSTLALPPTR